MIHKYYTSQAYSSLNYSTREKMDARQKLLQCKAQLATDMLKSSAKTLEGIQPFITAYMNASIPDALRADYEAHVIAIMEVLKDIGENTTKLVKMVTYSK